MWTDLVFNLLLLLMSDYVFVLAVSNVGYIVFNFLNLHAGWIHRLDRPQWDRPFRTPLWLLAAGFVLSFVNVALMALGANVWGAGTLISGLVFAALIIPVFLYRHYVQDKGQFPQQLAEDMYLEEGGAVRRAGVLPYLVLIAGAALTIGIQSVAS
jgi:amino acid transporter